MPRTRPVRTRTARRTLLAATAAVALAQPLTSPPAAAAPDDPDDAVVRWVDRHAVPVGRSGRDLALLDAATRGARVVGLGEAAHGVAQVIDLKRRAVEHLVARRGFRTVALEEDWTLGLLLEDYVQGRRHDRDALVRQMAKTWRTEETARLLDRLRRYNARQRDRADRVHVVGVEYFATRRSAYEAVRDLVAARAPEHSAEVAHILRLIEPAPGVDIGSHLGTYLALTDKQPHVAAAHRMHAIVGALPHRPGDRRHAEVLHLARQIRSFYEGFSLPWPEIPGYRDARAAENLRWMQRRSGHRVVYWAATSHVAAVDEVSYTEPGRPDTRFRPVGSYLDGWYGERYVRVGYTFDRGAFLTEDGEPMRVPAARDDWYEAPLAEVGRARFVVDLDRPAPPAVEEWLGTPMLTRGLTQHGHGSVATGGSPEDWYDVVVHVQRVAPTTPLRR